MASLTVRNLDGLGSRIKDHFADLGGLELELPQRIYSPESPDLRE